MMNVSFKMMEFVLKMNLFGTIVGVWRVRASPVKFIVFHPEVPSLDQIHETYTFSKTDALLLGAHLGIDAVQLITAQACGSNAAVVVNKILALISDAHAVFLTGLDSALPAALLPPTSSAGPSVFRTLGELASPVAVQSSVNLALAVTDVEPDRSVLSVFRTPGEPASGCLPGAACGAGKHRLRRYPRGNRAKRARCIAAVSDVLCLFIDATLATASHTRFELA